VTAPHGGGGGKNNSDRRAYLAFVREHHPDRGGDVDVFVAGLAEFQARRASTRSADQALSRYDAPVVVVVRPRGVRAVIARMRRWW